MHVSNFCAVLDCLQYYCISHLCLVCVPFESRDAYLPSKT
ncbi:hypothetical protein HMPREF3190_01408 [Umbribacter vaginalis]|nr:hypothetical protein HMPREF3190_01408 [Coriobacteriales bacterium DNF00809]